MPSFMNLQDWYFNPRGCWKSFILMHLFLMHMYILHLFCMSFCNLQNIYILYVIEFCELFIKKLFFYLLICFKMFLYHFAVCHSRIVGLKACVHSIWNSAFLWQRSFMQLYLLFPALSGAHAVHKCQPIRFVTPPRLKFPVGIRYLLSNLLWIFFLEVFC